MGGVTGLMCAGVSAVLLDVWMCSQVIRKIMSFQLWLTLRNLHVRTASLLNE